MALLRRTIRCNTLMVVKGVPHQLIFAKFLAGGLTLVDINVSIPFPAILSCTRTQLNLLSAPLRAMYLLGLLVAVPELSERLRV